MEEGQQAEESEVKGLLLDTHYWIWFQNGDASQLGARVRDEFLDAQRASKLYLSAISVLELARLVADGDLDLATTVDRFVSDATRDGGLQLLALSNQVLIESTRLPGNIHRDPSDRLLVATAREHGLTLITRDKDILKYAAQGHLSARKP